MTTNPSVNAVILFGVLGLLWFVWVGWLREQDVAVFRAELFQLRRELFLLLAEEKVTGNHPAYVHLRNMMNGLLRGAHRISFGQVIVTYAWLRSEKIPSPQNFAGKLEGLSPDVSRDLDALHNRVNHEIVGHLGRIWKYSILFPLVVFFQARSWFGTAKTRVVRIIEEQGLQYEAAASAS